MKQLIELILNILLGYLVYSLLGNIEFNPFLWSDFSKGSFYTYIIITLADVIKSFFKK
jgi:hypothetical protein